MGESRILVSMLGIPFLNGSAYTRPKVEGFYKRGEKKFEENLLTAVRKSDKVLLEDVRGVLGALVAWNLDTILEFRKSGIMHSSTAQLD